MARQQQPDSRVHPHELGMWVWGDTNFAINLRRGSPFNACIEEDNKESLRCWATKNYLDRRAAALVDKHATKTDKNAFIWNKNVKRGAAYRTHDGHRLYKVVFP